MVKDHRTGTESSQVDQVLDGGLDPFMESYLLGTENPESEEPGDS